MLTRLSFLTGWMASGLAAMIPSFKKPKLKSRNDVSLSVHLTNEYELQLHAQLRACLMATCGDHEALAIKRGEHTWSEALNCAQQLNTKYRALNDRVEKLRGMKELACRHGNADYDHYLHGMANGIIFALSVLDQNEPKYLDPPEVWINIDCSGFELKEKEK